MVGSNALRPGEAVEEMVIAAACQGAGATEDGVTAAMTGGVPGARV